MPISLFSATGCSLWKSVVELTTKKLVTRHGAIFQWRQHDRSLSNFGTVPARIGRTDMTRRRTDIPTVATALCIGAPQSPKTAVSRWLVGRSVAVVAPRFALCAPVAVGLQWWRMFTAACEAAWSTPASEQLRPTAVLYCCMSVRHTC